MNFWEAAFSLNGLQIFFLFFALLVAFGFEFINGFHDTANAVTTVIYTNSMSPKWAVLYSGFMNFLGVLIGGTGVAFGIVNLLPVERLVDESQSVAFVMVLAMLIAAVIWNLGTWYVGLPVSSSHTLIGSIIGVGIAHGLLSEGNLKGVRWDKASETALALLLSPILGFIVAGGILLLMKSFIKDQRLYVPPVNGEQPPGWIRWAIRLTCGGVSFAHGSNDGQKGMGLLMLVLVGFLPTLYALHPENKNGISPNEILELVAKLEKRVEDKEKFTDKDRDAFLALSKEIELLKTKFSSVTDIKDLNKEDRWPIRRAITKITNSKFVSKDEKKQLEQTIQYIPFWVIILTALCLGIGTTIGYKRIVVTVAEKIGKTHLTYAQGAIAELIASVTILFAVFYKLPVSTTHVLSSGVAGTMAANKSGLQSATVKKILLAWVVTLPVCMLLSATLFCIGFMLTSGTATK